MYYRIRSTVRSVSCLIGILVMAACASAADAQIDSINVGQPLASGEWTDMDNGWFYTPTFSYNLIGVSTDYSTVRGQTITEVIYNGNGNNLGSEITSATFSPTAGVFSGPTFAPIALTAGQEYFVGFENILFMGSNTSTSASATLLNERFDIPGDLTMFDDFDSVGNDDGFTAPELEFFSNGAPAGTPEPGSVALLAGIGFTSLFAAVHARRRR